MSVALGITGSSIKVISLKGRQVKKWASANIADGLVRDGLILQPKAVGEAISALFKSAGISRDGVVASIAGLSFTYRFIKLPRMKPGLVEEAMLRAARKEISLPLEELYISWQQLPDTGDELSFFVLGVPRNLIDAMVETLKIAGIEPYLMGIRPLALARIAEKRDAIIVNIQADCYDIVIMSGGIPMVIHTIAPRGENATLEDNIQRLADELTKTTTFFQSNHPEAELGPDTPLLLTGDITADSPAKALLQAEVEYEIEPLVPKVEYPADLPVDTYAAAIGLALKKTPPKTAARIDAASFTDINVNILDGKYRKPKAKPVPTGRLVLGIALVAAIGLLYPLYNAMSQVKADNAGLEAALDNINRQLNIATIIDEDAASTQSLIYSIKAEADGVKEAYLSVLGSRGHYTADMQTVISLLPDETYLNELNVTNDQIIIYGETSSEFSVIKYAQALESIGIFREIRINNIAEGSSAFFFEEDDESITPRNVIEFEIVITKKATVIS